MKQPAHFLQNKQRPIQLLKYIIAPLCVAITVFSLTQCAKNDPIAAEKEAAQRRSRLLANHIIPPADANAMVKRYDEMIGSLIEQRYKKNNPGYISPTQVVYDIDPLIAFLEELKADGNSQVVVRYAAIDGDNQNSRIPGLPYHGLLFYGSKKAPSTATGQPNPMGKSFDGGSLIPPPYPDDSTSRLGNY